MSKVFIAGAAGNIGSALVKALDGKVDVVAGVHSPEKGAALGAEARPFDFGDVDSMVDAMSGCDRMFLVLPLQEKMTRFGHLAVEAAKKAGIEYIVRSSGYAASSDAHWRLGRENGMVDQFVEDSGIPYTILRPNTFMQNFIGPYAGMIKSGVIALPEEKATVSYIDVRDIADCAAVLLQDNSDHENKFYALTGPEGLSLTDVAAEISRHTGKEVAYTPVPEEAYTKYLADMGVPEWNIKMLVSLCRVVKLGMAGNVTKAVEYLTGIPARTFSDFAYEYANTWK